MARTVNMVTRTIKSTKVTALCLDIVTAEPLNKTFVVSGTYPSDPKGTAKLLKKVKYLADTETFKVVAIADTEVEENLYGMTEEEFIAGAKILPARKTN